MLILVSLNIDSIILLIALINSKLNINYINIIVISRI